MKDAENIILKNVLEDVNVASLISDNFYAGQLATIKNTSYPCANFDLGSGENIEKMVELQSWSMRLWSWSGVSKTEAWNIYEAIFNLLNNQSITNDIDTIHVVIYETTRPIFNIEENKDEDDSFFYFMGRWSVKMIKQG